MDHLADFLEIGGSFLAGALATGIVIRNYFFGGLIANVTSTELSLRRVKSDNQFDDLVVEITIKKGKYEALALDSLWMHVFGLEEEKLKAAEESLRAGPPWNRRSPESRSLNHAGVLYSTRQILAFWPPEERDFNLVPHEQLRYGGYCRVPREAICEVIVSLNGFRYRHRKVQENRIYSIASAISIPSDVIMKTPDQPMIS